MTFLRVNSRSTHAGFLRDVMSADLPCMAAERRGAWGPNLDEHDDASSRRT
jgi:hypothetical protein